MSFKLKMTFKDGFVKGELDGKEFTVTQNGGETVLNGFGGDDNTFAGILSWSILELAEKALRAKEYLDAADLGVWDELDDDLADEIYDEIV